MGVLKQTIGVDANAEHTLAALRAYGLSRPDAELGNAVAIALMHSSYLYEHVAAFPRVTKGLLDALSVLGLSFVRKLAAVDVYKRDAFRTAGGLSTEVAEVAYVLESWAAGLGWLRESAALGRSFAATRPPAKVFEKLLRQVVGVLCLADEETVAARLLESLLSDVRRQRYAMVADPKKTLQDSISPQRAEYAYEREGPDHQPMFRCTVTDTRGRHGTGLSRSKKEAAKSAALDFLQRHIPQIFSIRPPEPIARPRATAIPEPSAHTVAVGKLQKLFELPMSATPLLSQALIHSSWVYEHRPVVGRCHQQDNQVLAFVGAEAAGYEDVLAASRLVTADPPGEFAFRGLANEGYGDLFRRSGLAPGLLLGAGQQSKITDEMGATAFQAIIGAVFVAKNFPANLARGWPQAWASMWQIIAPTTPRPADPTTALQEATSVMRLQTAYDFDRSGPDHASQYRAKLVLDSEILRVRTRVTGPPSASKTRAKHEASAAVLHILSGLAQPSLTRGFASATASDEKLARFLLAHLAAVVVTSSVPLRRWVAARLFGLHLGAEPGQLIAWAQGADQILDSPHTVEGGGARLESVFRTVLEPTSSPRPYLARALESLERINTPEGLTPEHLDQLAQLCSVYRCIGAEDPDTELSDVTHDWNFLYGGRLVTPTMPTARLTGRERAILDAAIAAMLLPGATVRAEVISRSPLCVRIVTATGPSPSADAISNICALWSGVTNTTVLSPVEKGIEVTTHAIELPVEPGPITTAVLAALRPGPQPYQASVADILHDLKNQIVAARQAITQSVENETAKLEQQLDARRHLDRAHVMIVQLRATTSLPESASDENVSVELGAFLRNYGRVTLAWLPDNIALSTPATSRPAYVAIDGRMLTAMLDNLVKNAAEAMPQGGAIRLGWAADKYDAIIEVADDGPGLPEETAQAFANGQRIRSSKAGGNGLGLLSASSLIRRLGGELIAAPVTSGTSWEITLPIVACGSEDHL